MARLEFTTAWTARWTLGRLSPVINFVAIVRVIAITIVVALPPAYWNLSPRRRLAGPAAATP